ncbi:MAG: hypothetical protein WC819_04200 [Parcubacteria group bacterium]|jgi:hypothetical protein
MSKNRNNKRKQERRLQKKKSSLIECVVGVQRDDVNEGRVPESVASMGDVFDDSEVYSISFSQYASNECEIDAMISNGDKCSGRALQLLKLIGSHCSNLRTLKHLGFETKKIANDNQYKRLYNKLKMCGVDIKETTIYESYISNQGGRIFFWVYGQKKMIYIVAIRRNHYK